MKKWIVLLLVAMGAVPALAEENSAGKENAIAALKVSLPEAVVDYAVRESDDGGYEWDLFFTLGSQIGECEVLESTNEIRKVTLYEKPEGALNAGEAMARLAKSKGDAAIIELDVEEKKNGLRYEGEAELDGKRYEFEMTADGEMVEWERD